MCNKTFVRKLEIEFISETLILHQKYEGDVGCVVWDAAIVLAKYLEETIKQQKFCFKDKNVVELGAGVGCAGLTAACFGANVLLTDLAEVIPLLELNVKENRKVVERHGGSVKASALMWGDKDSNVSFKPDMILLADCIYYKQSIDKLLETLEKITEDDTRILISQEMRDSDVQKNCWEYFVKRASKKFSFNYIPLSVQNPKFRCHDIKLIELRKKTSD